MTSSRARSATMIAMAITFASGVSTYAIAQVQDAARNIGNNDSVFIDGKTLTITQGVSKDDVASQIAKLGAREMGPGAIVFRSGDKLYIVDVAPLPPQALNDPANARQQSYGGMYDRQQSYGGMYDRQQSYGGMYYPEYANFKLKKTFEQVWGAAAGTEKK